MTDNLYTYAVCSSPPHAGCNGDTGWFSSMGLSLFGGFTAVTAGAALGMRRHLDGRNGTWFPLAGFRAVLALMGLSIVILHAATHT